jgi:hypothetical protein
LELPPGLQHRHGRESRSCSVATRFTSSEEKELKAAAYALESSQPNGRETPFSPPPELVTKTAPSLPNSPRFAEVRNTKHEAARDVLNQYQNPKKEQ